MSRTKSRPIPSGRVARQDAAAFGLIFSVLAVMLLAMASNYVAAGLLAFTIFFYAVVYSMWLKRSTPQNIVIGGAAGALPPVVGWASATGTAPLEAWLLFAIIFLWTPPHFWALSLYKQGDYAAAGIPMMPVAKGETSTRRQIFGYSLVLALAGIAPYFAGMASYLYLGVASLLGLGFVWRALGVMRETVGELAAAKKLFGFSIVYLFGVFLALLVEHLAGFHG